MDDEGSAELLAVEYVEEEDDSEKESAIELRKKLLLGLGVDIDAEPAPAVVEDATEDDETATTTATTATPKPVLREVQPDVASSANHEAHAMTSRDGRALLSVIDANNVRWLSWDDMPERLRKHVASTAPDAADARAVRVGGYWRAASMNNRQRRKSKSRNGFPLRQGEVEEEVKECNQRHVVTNIQCFNEHARYAVITVEASHTFYPGDYVTFERIGAQDAEHAREINRQHRVFAVPVPLNADVSALNWDNIWAESPLVLPRQSVFAVSFDTPGSACDAFPVPSAIVRRSANTRLPFC